MRLQIAIVLLAAAVAVPSNAWAAHRYQYIINATNKIQELLAQSSPPSPTALAAATSEGCAALSILAKDGGFRVDLYRLAKGSRRTLKDREYFKRDLYLFATSVLVPEKQALINAGLHEDVASKVILSASQFRDAVAEPLDPKRVLNTINNFRVELCAGAEALTKARKEQKATQRTIATVRRWAFRFGGAAVVVVDVAVALPVPIAVSSGAIGGAMMGWGR